MREIKFRAWDKDYKKMITNFLLPESKFFGMHRMAISFTGEVFTFPDWDMAEYDEDEMYNSAKYPSRFKIMQYIGRKDKNGKEVYEYDIVKHQGEHHTVYGIVRFGEAPDIPGELRHLGFYIEWQNDGMNEWDKWWRSDIIYWLKEEGCEVVGNIYENPELIGERHED